MGRPQPEDRTSRPVAVIGAGTLGRRIAMMFATRGGTVRIFDPDAGQRRAAADFAAHHLADTIGDFGLGPAGRVEASDDQTRAVQDTWLVVEAVPERLDLKKKVFAQLDAEAPPDAILASNSSSYASRSFIDDVKRPERVLNTHIYMPPTTTGLDVVLDIEEHYAAEDPSLPEGPRELLREYVGKGRLGVKSGAGFYDYTGG